MSDGENYIEAVNGNTNYMTEAGASVTLRLRSTAGIEVMLTMRDAEAGAMFELLNQVDGLIAHAIERGWSPVTVPAPNGWHAPSTPAEPEAPPPAELPMSAPSEAKAALAVTDGAAPSWVRCAQLARTIIGGKPYWRISSAVPPYQKFGVRVWPEVLAAAGVLVDKLDQDTYSFGGYEMLIVLKSDGSGKPEKVTQLRKVAA